MNFLSPDNAWVAFLAGLITSPHCLLMCGPLAYVVLFEGRESEIAAEAGFFKPHLLYNIARIIAFTTMGIVAGGMGLSLLKFFNFSVIRIFPWILVTFFIVFGLGWDRLIPKAPFAKRIFARFSEKISYLPKNLAAILLGFATPFLPCGPLYIILWVALLSGSPLFGAEITFGFALGTFPLMYLAGTQYKKLRAFLNPKRLYLLQRLVALLAAAFLAWRLLANNSPLSADFCCPW